MIEIENFVNRFPQKYCPLRCIVAAFLVVFSFWHQYLSHYKFSTIIGHRIKYRNTLNLNLTENVCKIRWSGNEMKWEVQHKWYETIWNETKQNKILHPTILNSAIFFIWFGFLLFVFLLYIFFFCQHNWLNHPFVWFQ